MTKSEEVRRVTKLCSKCSSFQRGDEIPQRYLDTLTEEEIKSRVRCGFGDSVRGKTGDQLRKTETAVSEARYAKRTLFPCCPFRAMHMAARKPEPELER